MMCKKITNFEVDNRMNRKSQAGKTGPKPETVKLQGDWRDMMGKALHKKRPKEGWPKPEKGKKK